MKAIHKHLLAILNYLLARFKEKSTWLGLTMVVSAFVSDLTPEQQIAIQTFGAALFAFPETAGKDNG